MKPCQENTGKKGITNATSSVLLLGLDFGSTTSSALVASAHILTNTITGNMELGDIKIIFRSEIAFTPFINEQIDEQQVNALLEHWLNSSGYSANDFFAGGVIITGLAARQKNAEFLAKLIENKLGEILVATADDPNFESWLAFMGSCAALSRYHQDTLIINLDIGGGTTNPAVGLNGKVLQTGCYFIGARHIQFEKGTYKIKALTHEAQTLLNWLGIPKQVNDTLSYNELNKFLAFYIESLERIALGETNFFSSSLFLAPIQQVPFTYTPLDRPTAITFSGGVGELVYQAASGNDLPPTTFYGDLGIDLARAILASPILSKSLHTIVPENQGRATVYGLALHSTEVSGTTLYLPDPSVLPIRHLPIIAQCNGDITRDELANILQQICQSKQGGSVQLLTANSTNYQQDKLTFIRVLGKTIFDILTQLKPPSTLPIIILIDSNIGKSLGAYATNWGQLKANLIVIDEMMLKEASFVNISKQYQQVVPISFYGIK